jgi:hypothetical protein
MVAMMWKSHRSTVGSGCSILGDGISLPSIYIYIVIPCYPNDISNNIRYPMFAGWDFMGMGQNPVPLVNIKMAGKWMFIPLKMVCVGIDPYPYIYM